MQDTPAVCLSYASEIVITGWRNRRSYSMSSSRRWPSRGLWGNLVFSSWRCLPLQSTRCQHTSTGIVLLFNIELSFTIVHSEALVNCLTNTIILGSQGRGFTGLLLSGYNVFSRTLHNGRPRTHMCGRRMSSLISMNSISICSGTWAEHGYASFNTLTQMIYLPLVCPICTRAMIFRALGNTR